MTSAIDVGYLAGTALVAYALSGVLAAGVTLVAASTLIAVLNAFLPSPTRPE